MKKVSRISAVIFFTAIFFLFTKCEEKKSLPVVVTKPASEITYTSASSGGAVTDEGGTALTDVGVCWNTVANPKVANSKSAATAGFGPFKSELIQLSPNTKYYLRAYATNSVGTAYGNEVSFTTVQSEPPTLITTVVTSINQTSALTGGNITRDNGAQVTIRGVCWDTIAQPTVELSQKTGDGSGTGTFTSNLTNLKPDTKYYVRAFASSTAGTGYGNEINFTTSEITIPDVSTDQASLITQVSAVSGGNVTNDRGSAITLRGICWSISTAPTIGLSTKTVEGAGKGVFVGNLTDLLPGTTYYVRAYATNIAGTGYGNEVTFLTSPAAKANVTTADATSISFNSAISGGDITNDFGGPVTAKGICWSTNPGPTVDLLTKTSDGTGSGIFSSNLIGLDQNTQYYVRAYVTNIAGTNYGNEVTFTTSPFSSPSLTTSLISAIGLNSATSGGEVTNENGSMVISRGVCWSTSSAPTIGLATKTDDGTGPGIFTSVISGLQPGTTYYVRAYATNGIGTSYGNEIVFNTMIADVIGNNYNTVTIGAQVWMSENLKTSKYNDNYDITYTPVYSDWASLTVPGYCWYNTGNSSVYGALYNWYAVSSTSNGGKNICPVGWHVPSDSDWDILVAYLGGDGMAGGKLKEAGTSHWASPNTGATNETGFNALPAGVRNNGGGAFTGAGSYAAFWSSTENSPGLAWYRDLQPWWSTILRNTRNEVDGLSIRCLKDQ